MPHLQSYNTDPTIAFAGMVADTSPATIVSRTVEGGTIGFGLPAAVGAADRSVKAMESGAKLQGITVRLQGIDAAEPNGIKVGDTAAVLLSGAIYVEPGVDVVFGEPVYVTDAGAFTNVTTGNTRLERATFETTATAGGLAVERIV